MKKLFQVSAVAAALLSAADTHANLIDFNTPAGAFGSDGPLSAQAIVEVSVTGVVTVTLINKQANPTSAGQLISGLVFDVTGASGGPSVTSSSGVLATIGSGGSYSPGAASSLSHWAVSLSGSEVRLTTLSGGQPNQLIIGPDDAGSVTGGGDYSSANSSIFNFNPSVLGTATFTLSIPGVTAISDVAIQFGTGPETTLGPVAVPDGGSTLGLLGVALCGLGILGRKLRTK